MHEPRPKIVLDDLGVTAIAVPLKPLPENIAVSAVFPFLYEHGLALIVDRHDVIERCIVDVKLDNDNPLLLEADVECLSEDATVHEAKRIFEETSQKLIPILNRHGQYTGNCASRNEMLRIWNSQVELPRIGGLATPLGVYLTTGIHTTGAGTYGLILTGVSFSIFVITARMCFQYLSIQFFPVEQVNEVVQMALIFVILLVIIRITPLAGIHAAEHQTIHAMEKAIPLTPENVYAQPKSHKRCGTNIMVALVGLEMGIIGAMSIEPPEYSIIFIIAWMIFLILAWQFIGIFVQELFTTCRPSRSQVDNAIKAGKQLIDRYRVRPHGNPKIWQRIWGSGMIQILATFILTSWIFQQMIDIWLKRF